MKIGFINTCHPDYQFPSTLNYGHDALTLLEGLNDNTEVASYPVPMTTHEQAMEAAQLMRQNDVSGVVLFLGAYVMPSCMLALLKELPKEMPLCVWSMPMEQREAGLFTTGSYVGYAMFKGTLDRIGRRYVPVCGFAYEEKTQRSLYAFVSAANAALSLRRSRMGLVGYTAMAIYPGSFDHVLLSWLIGPEVEHFDSYQIIRDMENITDEECADALKLYQAADLTDVSEEMLKKSLKMYVAIERICKDYHLDALTIKCQFEFSKMFGMTPCVPLSVLADHGVITSCEGDMPCLVSTAILKYLSGTTATYGDALHHDAEKNTIKLSPCGFLPFSLGKPGACRVVTSQDVKFAGIKCSFVMHPGQVTILRLVEDVGSYHLVYAVGEGLETELRGGSMPALDIKLKGSVERLFNHYAGQHFAVCYGDWSEAIEKLGMVMGLEVVSA